MLSSGLDAVAHAGRLTPHPLDGTVRRRRRPSHARLRAAGDHVGIRRLPTPCRRDGRNAGGIVAGASLRHACGTRGGGEEDAKCRARSRTPRPYRLCGGRISAVGTRSTTNPDVSPGALSIAMGEDVPESQEGALATPLVFEAGGTLGEGMRRISEHIRACGTRRRTEEHCIPLYEHDLRRGKYHCLVIEDALGRSTVLVEECVRWRRLRKTRRFSCCRTRMRIG